MVKLLNLRTTGILFVWLFFIACGKKSISSVTTPVHKQPIVTEKSINEPIKPTSVQQPEEHYEPLSIPTGVDTNLLFSLQRTSCFGLCPAFKIEVFKNKKAFYTGIAHTKRLNKHQAEVTAEMIAQIQKKATEINYFEWETKYPSTNIEIADLPSTISYIRIGGKGKMIFNNYDAPKQLMEFEKWLEKTLDSLDWKISN